MFRQIIFSFLRFRLRSRNPGKRASAIRHLAAVGIRNGDAVLHLVNALTDHDEKVRITAVHSLLSLGKWPGPTAPQNLRDRIQAFDASVIRLLRTHTWTDESIDAAVKLLSNYFPLEKRLKLAVGCNNHLPFLISLTINREMVCNYLKSSYKSPGLPHTDILEALLTIQRTAWDGLADFVLSENPPFEPWNDYLPGLMRSGWSPESPRQSALLFFTGKSTTSLEFEQPLQALDAAIYALGWSFAPTSNLRQYFVKLGEDGLSALEQCMLSDSRGNARASAAHILKHIPKSTRCFNILKEAYDGETYKNGIESYNNVDWIYNDIIEGICAHAEAINFPFVMAIWNSKNGFAGQWQLRDKVLATIAQIAPLDILIDCVAAPHGRLLLEKCLENRLEGCTHPNLIAAYEDALAGIGFYDADGCIEIATKLARLGNRKGIEFLLALLELKWTLHRPDGTDSLSHTILAMEKLIQEPVPLRLAVDDLQRLSALKDHATSYGTVSQVFGGGEEWKTSRENYEMGKIRQWAAAELRLRLQ